jgi:two-component sensor histidine kinase
LRKWDSADVVIAVCAGLLLTIFGVFALLVWQGYSQTISGAHERARTAANLVAMESEWALRTALAMLGQVVSDIEADPGRRSEEVASSQAALSSLPVDALLGVFDAAGTRLEPAAGAAFPDTIQSAGYFRDLAAGSTWVISPNLEGSSSMGEFFAVAQRIAGPDGFAGAVVLAIDQSLLERFWLTQDLGPQSTSSLIGADGVVVTRYPRLEEALDLSNLPVHETLLASEAGSYDSPQSPADGVSRVVGFRHVEGLGLIATASVGRDEILANLWNAVRTVLFLMGPIGIALLIGSVVTARLLRQNGRTMAALEQAVESNKVLFSEIHHRVKNNLQSVNSLLQLQPIPREIKADMGQRIAAMSAVHEHIYRSNDFSNVRVKDYLHTLVENIKAGQPGNVQVVEDIEDLSVDKDMATPIGLILNEVVSNAFKHAFRDGRAGTVKVTVKGFPDEGVGRLAVEDNGTGFDEKQASTGIGRRLVSAFTEQLRGQSVYRFADGTCFELTFPLATA